ncbi:MAG: transcriptional regulator, MarR family [Naasia sp.]|nr:transcriptional regulator, MarR family [Naasia sp.]
MADSHLTPEGELRILLQKVARRIRAERSDDSISDSQLSVLRHLDLTGDSTPGELAGAERVSPPSMNRTVNALEEAGYVLRRPSPDDARKVLVSLTEAGRGMTLETRRLRAEWFAARLGELDDDERGRLLAVRDVLRKLADS